MNALSAGQDHHRLFANIFAEGLPLLDVRAPVEFAQGAFPGAVNLPILNDAEREKVGICYQQQGPEAAEELGHRLVSGEYRAALIQTWQTFLAANPGAWLYCFRGGKRSQLAEAWLRAEGSQVQRIPGGYKALRHYLLGVLAATPPLLVLAGKTGCGKTDLLVGLARQVDLEQRANHRGSAFGKQIDPQPAQIDFENALAVDFLRQARQDPRLPVVVEDEGRAIGRLSVPLPVQAKMKAAPVILLEDHINCRSERICNEYIVAQFAALLARHGDEALAHASHEAAFLESLAAVQKRLGGVAYQRLRSSMTMAFQAQRQGDFAQHQIWITDLLGNYYDPMYEYQLNNKAERIVFRGDFAAVTAYLREHTG